MPKTNWQELQNTFHINMVPHFPKTVCVGDKRELLFFFFFLNPAMKETKHLHCFQSHFSKKDLRINNYFDYHNPVLPVKHYIHSESLTGAGQTLSYSASCHPNHAPVENFLWTKFSEKVHLLKIHQLQCILLMISSN